MANYNVSALVAEASRRFYLNGKVITIPIGATVGIGTWGKLDCLKRAGYSIIREVR